jgi:hypothetical protein
VKLRPGVAREAAARAQRETLPSVTVVGPDDLGHIPVTNRAWRDHVPDMYIFSLRQLLEVAQRQAAARERTGRDTARPRGRDRLPPPRMQTLLRCRRAGAQPRRPRTV